MAAHQNSFLHVSYVWPQIERDFLRVSNGWSTAKPLAYDTLVTKLASRAHVQADCYVIKLRNIADFCWRRQSLPFEAAVVRERTSPTHKMEVALLLTFVVVLHLDLVLLVSRGQQRQPRIRLTEREWYRCYNKKFWRNYGWPIVSLSPLTKRERERLSVSCNFFRISCFNS